jgi:hypothetical protein
VHAQVDVGRYPSCVRRLLSARLLILAGSVAAASAVIFGAIGVAIFGEDMWPNLLAELCGVSLEVAIIILVIERVATYQRRRDARFAYDALADRAAMTFVDAMRLLWVCASAVAMNVNGPRYDEFRQLAELHLAEFRSNIEGFAASLDASSHESLRRIDRRLSWAIVRLGGKPQRRPGLDELKELLAETAEIIDAFLERNGGPAFQEAKQNALAALETTETASTRGAGSPADGHFRWRLEAQTEYLRNSSRSRPAPRGILYDPDNELAFGYFSIDRAILAREN